MGAAVGDHGRLPALGEEDGERFAEENGPLRTVLEVLEPRDRLPAATQSEGDVFAGRDSSWAIVKHRVIAQDCMFAQGCLPR